MVIRDIVKVPISKSYIAPDFIDAYNTDKYYYRMDVFTDSSWDKTQERPIVFYWSGAGINAPYPIDSSMVLRNHAEGWLTVVVYYYQATFNDVDNPDLKTTPPPWNERWGDQYNYQHHLRCRSVMVQSALEYCIESLYDDIGVNFNRNEVFFACKSRGGATCLAWSYFYADHKYSSNVKLIINAQGFMGSSEKGFLSWDDTLSTLTLYTTWGNHKFIHCYNDQDVGDYDLAMRMMYSIPHNRLVNHTFMNFSDVGHTANFEFNAQAILANLNNVPFVYEGLYLENQLELTKKALLS